MGKLYPSYGVESAMKARFLCGHHTLLAHAKLAKWYHNEFKGRGRITFKNSGNYFQPVTNTTSDLAAAQRSYDFVLGWFGGVWSDGDYPQSLKDTLGDILPEFTEGEKEIIKGSCDFYAIDAYTAFYVSELTGGVEACAGNRTHPSFPECANQTATAPDGFGIGPAADLGANWLKNTPIGVRKFLTHITKVLFPKVKDIMVTEFGFAEPFESDYTNVQDATWDLRRSDYIQGFLDNILLAITEDKINVTGALVWSICKPSPMLILTVDRMANQDLIVVDNFEWGSGIKTRFGLQYLNYDTLERTPKASWFQTRNWFK